MRLEDVVAQWAGQQSLGTRAVIQFQHQRVHPQQTGWQWQMSQRSRPRGWPNGLPKECATSTKTTTITKEDAPPRSLSCPNKTTIKWDPQYINPWLTLPQNNRVNASTKTIPHARQTFSTGKLHRLSGPTCKHAYSANNFDQPWNMNTKHYSNSNKRRLSNDHRYQWSHGDKCQGFHKGSKMVF